MAAGVAARRIQDLVKLRCALFSQTYNPLNTRTGGKILRQRLRGPAYAAYYPRRVTTQKELENMFPELETFDEDESDRWDAIALRKARGKGNPKKKRTKEESKKFTKRRPAAAKAVTGAGTGTPA